jgi:hypothetical protein
VEAMTKRELSRTLALLRKVILSLRSLPSKEEVREVDSAVEEAISLLTTLKEKLTSVLDEEESRRTREALTEVCAFLEKLQRDTGIAAAVGLKSARSASSKQKTLFLQKPAADFADLTRKLETLSTGDIQRELMEPKKYTVKMLEKIARHLQIQVDPHAPKHELVDKIVKIGFANPRAYSGLAKQNL